ncbi:MAG: hypothetical protein WDM86_18940 [Rhizomicrobium sp.]
MKRRIVFAVAFGAAIGLGIGAALASEPGLALGPPHPAVSSTSAESEA